MARFSLSNPARQSCFAILTPAALIMAGPINCAGAPALDAGQLYNRGDLYLRQGDTASAIARYSEIINGQPQETKAYYRRALAYRIGGAFRDAIADYGRIIAGNPEDADAFNNRGLAYTGARDFSNAIDDFNRAVELTPGDPPLYYNRGQAYRLSGNNEAAIADYSKAIEFNPRYAIAYNARGRAYHAMQDDGKALADYNTAIQLDKNLVSAYFSRALMNGDQGKGQEALADLGQAIALDPSDPDLRIARGLMLSANGEQERALVEYSAAAKSGPNGILYAARAAAEIKLGRMDAALDHLNRALLLNPELPPGYQMRASLYMAMGRPVQAEIDKAKLAELLAAEKGAAMARAAEKPKLPPTAAGGLGIQVGSLDKNWANEHKLRSTNGAHILKVIRDSSVSKAGIRQDDVILEVDGQQVDSPPALARIIASAHAGDSVALLIFRDGKLITAKVTLEVSPSSPDVEDEKLHKYLRDDGGPSGNERTGADNSDTRHKRPVPTKANRGRSRPRTAASAGDQASPGHRRSIDPILGSHIPDHNDVLRGLPRPPRFPGE